jgi:hypothetical protein
MVKRVLGLLFALVSSAGAQELPPGCATFSPTWVKGDMTAGQTSAFVAVIADSIGLKWATWSDGDQTLSVNIMEGTWKGVMCMSTAPAKSKVSVVCRIPGVTISADKARGQNTEVMICMQPETVKS